jgi:pyruvate,water dikinase
VATKSAEATDFPSPFSIETPAGCEGWQEMYPYWALFDEHRRESDENRLWFWNSQHFPFPMPPFDMVEVDHPYYTLGGWQNRAFAVPPAMGVDYRVVNGYVYISPNPVTDP